MIPCLRRCIHSHQDASRDERRRDETRMSEAAAASAVGRKVARRSHPSCHQIWNPRPTTHVSALYPEIMSMIFSYLDVQGKGRVSRVCMAWREAAYRKSVWRGIEAKLHLKKPNPCPTLFPSLVQRGIKRVQVRAPCPSLPPAPAPAAAAAALPVVKRSSPPLAAGN